MRQPSRLYTAIAGIFLLLQGTSTLAFRLIPALDRAFPPLLATTQMMPLHSMLHILTGIIALIVLRWGGRQGTVWFAAVFGLFYAALAASGMTIGQPHMLHMQPFDHPIHLVLGVVGIAVAAFDWYRITHRKSAS